MGNVVGLHNKDVIIENLHNELVSVIHEHTNRSNISHAAVVGVLTIITDDVMHDVREFNKPKR